ncbi:MAG: pilus assembly protein PilM [Planctomycetota bacterium]|nr:pilus assembly protein PilM [Planctomycetota bacterium]
MADFDEVWCIDAGRSSLKAVKLQRAGNGAEIVAAEKIENPGGTEVDSSAAAVSALAARHDLSGALVVTLPSRSALTSFIPIPPVAGKKLDELIGYEAQQNIPLPIDEVIWASHVSGDTDDGEKEVGIFAVRSEEISDLLVDYSQDDLEVDVLTLGNVGLLNLIRFDLRPTRPIVAIEIGSDHTDLIIVNGSRFWFRSIPIAGKDFTQALQDKFGCSEQEAENLKVTAAQSEHAAKIFKEVQPLLRDLVSEINRSIGYFKSRVGEIKIEDLFLFGGSSKLVGLRKFLEENLRIRVQLTKNLSRIRVGTDAITSGIQQEMATYCTAVGGALQGLGLADVDLNLLPQEKQEAVQFQKKKKTVLIAAASLYILIAFFNLNFGGKITRAEAVLAETGIVKELKKNQDRLEELAGADSQDLLIKQDGLLSRGTGRLIPREILGIVATVVPADLVANVLSLRAEDGPEKDSVLRNVEADQEILNGQKTWLAGLDLRKIRVTSDGVILEDAKSKPDSGVQVYDDRYEVVVHGFRYDAGNAASNDQKLNELIVIPIEAQLAELYGEADPGTSRVERTVLAETMLMFLKSEGIKSGSIRGAKPDPTLNHGTNLYPWKIRWIHPPLPGIDSDSETENE